MNDYLPCATCDHPAEAHKLETRDDDLPLVLYSAPCEATPGCGCDDYDGMAHPDRPSLADAWVYPDEDGGVGVV